MASTGGRRASVPSMASRIRLAATVTGCSVLFPFSRNSSVWFLYVRSRSIATRSTFGTPSSAKAAGRRLSSTTRSISTFGISNGRSHASGHNKGIKSLTMATLPAPYTA
eukprot:Amastigsp_a9247_59.p4 type:complete len:109 gc:universal Amastigsp_a9247_59:169-495(+)